MRDSHLRVVWNNDAVISFQKILADISKTSPENAKKLGADIVNIIDRLARYPDMYPPDKFKKGNSLTFRAFEKHSYRVAYKVSATEIRILRIRHIKQEPLEY